ncbi:hypothetical protein VFPPC_09706 [Pochonia chlamydosporia 170]|uniref:Uncharacterized protein n=1 Tax=Pochonia chlamydosporia 170 TaxID=1380566 RepID=A0A179FE24_METCM|nr:hypothetical protein VFPPC_09706 [Pochonia chlamydosporia 170]OAQ63637.1 hypothetical protein VFPPC_09706 [Pochonia chlamydosporia 170]
MGGKSPYTPSELADLLSNFYQFLSTLHYDPAELQHPPTGGWPGLTTRAFGNWKDKTVVESKLIDYATADLEMIKSDCTDREEDIEFWSTKGKRHRKYIVYLAFGHESGGRELLLNVRDGEIIEDVLETDTLSPCDVRRYLNKLKLAYRSLKLIPCVGRITIEADKVPETVRKITEEEVLAQSVNWGTALDVQYVRQLYREHGWPEAFRREDAKAAVDSLMGLVMERRDDEWEMEDEYWLSEGEAEDVSMSEEDVRSENDEQ